MLGGFLLHGSVCQEQQSKAKLKADLLVSELN